MKHVTMQDMAFTYEDYLHLPDDGKRWEIVKGELFMTPAPGTTHQRVSRELMYMLLEYVKQKDSGEVLYAPTDVVLSDRDVVQPDVLYISDSRRSIVTERNVQGAPDLVVEIVSSSTAKLDRVYKRRLYEQYGVQEYWIVDPDAKTVEVFLLRGGHYEAYGTYGEGDVLQTPLLPLLAVDLREIFGGMV